MTEFIGYLIPGITTGCVYALIALGFVLIYKCSGILNLAQGWLVIFGSYLFFAFSVDLGLSLPLALLLTFVSAIVLGLVVERFITRPMIGQPVLAVVMVTLALGTLLEGVMVLGWGSEQLVLPRLFPSGKVSFLETSISYDHIGFLIVPVVLLLAFTIFFKYSKIGLSMMATSDDQQSAQSLGMSVKRIMAVSWVITCLVSVLGGVLLTNITGAHYSMVGIGLRAIAVVLLGGLESVLGVIIAGPLVGIIESAAAGYIDPLVGGGFRDIASFIVIILILMIKPYGLFGWARIERV